MNLPDPTNSRRSEAVALLAAAVFPTVAIWLYFVALADQSVELQRGAYSIAKLLQFGFPLVWVLAVRRERLWNSPVGRVFQPVQNDSRRAGEPVLQVSEPRAWPPGRGVLVSLLFGAAVAALMLAVYWFWLKPGGWLAAAAEPVARKAADFGATTAATFAAWGVFVSVFHSFLEEYYWRWFLFGRLRRLMPIGAAIALSSLAFMGHHVVVLGIYFGGLSGLTVVFSLAVAIGGAVWAWLYQRSGSLLGPWLSHILIDAAIFAVGYDLLRAG